MTTLNPEQWREVSPYLDKALEMPEAERASLLASLDEINPELARFLRSLLEEHHALARGEFLEHTPAPLPQQPALAGQSIGAYTLKSPIGQGGMGSVWLAQRSDGRFERQVAVKFLSIALVGDVGAERFKREGRLLGQLAHPHIAGLVDAGVSRTGQPFLVLEYVDGQHIDRYCDRHKLDVEGRVRLFLDVLAAVAHAHAHLIIHRDIKPSNVLVATDRQVKLLDFGIAKLVEDEGRPAAATLLTQEAGSALTPEYASPEQVNDEPVTTATDVYGLGVLLYVLLTGRHPAGPGPHSTAALVKAIVEIEPPRPSDAVIPTGTRTETGDTQAAARSTTPDRLSRTLRGDLDTIVLKALKKNPQQRYISAIRLADDLLRYLKHEPIGARPDSFAYRGGKFLRRNRTAVGLATLALFATIVGISTTLFQTRVAREQRDLAFRERDRASRITEFISGMFKVSDPSEARGNSITAREILDKASKEIESGLAKDPETQAQLMDVMGNVYESLGLYPSAEPLLDRVVDTQRRILGPRNPDTLRSMDHLGVLLYDEGQYAEAEKLDRETLEIRRDILGREDPETLTSIRHLAATLERKGRFAEAEKFEREALEIQRRVLGPEHPGTLLTTSNLAFTLIDQGRYTEAEGLQHEALEIQRRVLGPEHPDTLKSVNILAWTLFREGRYTEAERLQREELGIQRRVLGAEHPDTLTTINNLAGSLVSERRYVEAERLYRGGIDIQRRVLGPEHPVTLMAIANLATCLEAEGRYVEAERLLRQVLDIQRRVLGPEHQDTAVSVYNLGVIAGRQGRRSQALSLLREAVDHGLPPESDLGIDKDPELDSLHGDSRFAALVAHAKERAAAAPKAD